MTSSAVNVVDHPLVAHHLTELRHHATRPPQFRAAVRRLAGLLTYEATRDLSVEETTVETPLTTTSAQRLRQQIGLIPILRAGLGMVDPVLDLIPDAQVWHLGLYRDETTAKPVEYYSKLPDENPVDLALVLDPMLATGGSASAAIATLTKWGAKTIRLLSIIAAPEGIKVVQQEYPETQIYVCAVDERLNDQKFIFPGLGDAGDRSFNTHDA
jgi:uracil phosphoribosyltransferase